MVEFRPRPRPLPAEPLDSMEAEIDKIEPWLKKTEWAAMTDRMIPSVLDSADLLLSRLDASAGAEPERAAALRERLSALRTGFRRIKE